MISSQRTRIAIPSRLPKVPLRVQRTVRTTINGRQLELLRHACSSPVAALKSRPMCKTEPRYLPQRGVLPIRCAPPPDMASNLHRNPPFRAEHLGSLLRPDELLKTRSDSDNGTAPQKQLTAIEDTSVKDIAEEQIKLGFHAISDGEYRRHSVYLLNDLPWFPLMWM